MDELIKICSCGVILPVRNKSGKCRKCYKTEYEKQYCLNRYAGDVAFANKQKQRTNQYRRTHNQQRIKYNTEYRKRRERDDLSFKLANYLRSRLTHAISGNLRGGSAVRDLGCSLEEFRSYLESLWQPGMSWDNYNRKGWHIDHIQPLSKFDLTDPSQFKKACHYTNLQPLWADDNWKKGDKYVVC